MSNEHVIIMIMIIIELRSEIRDIYNLLTVPRTVSNAYAQVASAQSRANHVQHIEGLSRAILSIAAWYEGTAQV